MKKKIWISIIMSAVLLSSVLYQPLSATESGEPQAESGDSQSPVGDMDFFGVETDGDVIVDMSGDDDAVYYDITVDGNVTAEELLFDKSVKSKEYSIIPVLENASAEDSRLAEARTALAEIVRERGIMALVYLSDEYPIRISPSYDSETAVTVLSGQQVNILDMEIDEDGEVWEYVRLEYKGRQVYGYVPRSFLACSDIRFLEWEQQYGTNPGKPVMYSILGETAYPDIGQFPESYQPALLELKKQHPNWTFVVMNTTLDWNKVIDNEMQDGRSLVHKSMSGWMKDGLYDTGNWHYATEEALKLYMDPRNYLTENAIFQFEQLTYNEEYHTMEALENFLDNTFMRSADSDGSIHYAPGTDLTYAHIFWAIGSDGKRNVSPFHLVARVLQEQGDGTSSLISGTYQGYEGYYNYFNIGATGTTDTQVIENGLRYARDKDWKSAYYSIEGGTDIISANYIQRGQDTLYLQKYNVNPSGYYAVYTHQYMQNISAPATEAKQIRDLYDKADSLNSPFVFKIPVYQNMPAEACGIPPKTTDVSLTMPAGYADTTVWLDGVPYQGEVTDGRLVAHALNENAKTAVIYQYNTSGVPVNMYVWSLRYNGTFYVATAEPGLENLLSYHGFSIRITGKSGIRFKTGISTALRESLATTGVSGYTLKEYGTLVMNNANRGQYAMVRGGEKIADGMAYGVDSSGKRQDVIYETVDGRYRYTSVLVGMPPDQYKTEYAFRGYAVLEKDGKQVVIYGPVMARSIYSLAEQLLDQDSYGPGTSAYEFLQKLIKDADSL